MPAPAVAGVRFVPIDRALLADEALTNADEVRSEVRWMWSSEERFLERGFGVAALVERHILCWCTAEYVSRKACGIGITTDAGCRSRGIATATAARFVAECRTRGLAPYWECAGDNLPSVRVAEKLGFEILEETTVLRGAFAARAAE